MSDYRSRRERAKRREEVEEQAVEEATKLNSKLVYEVIRRDGEEELERTNRSLFWAGVAAGILISFSVIGEAVLRSYLPDAPSSYLIENFGYSLGFLLVILGRMQLFTENTITTVLPLIRDPSAHMFAAVARLWALVLGANVIGAFGAGAFIVWTGGIPDVLMPAIVSLSEHATGMGPLDSFVRAIPAGILVAAIVWMMPQAEGSEVLLIVIFTWAIAAGDFTHIIAGSVEMAILMLRGDLALAPAVLEFFLPVLAGNILGGTAIFSLIAWGQVRDEFRPARRRGKK
ncbi:MAG: formate/nitrite transporter family protein [Paracoccaceae bacterium]